jgi:uncharacterized protein YjiS (DUF1127 family)
MTSMTLTRASGSASRRGVASLDGLAARLYATLAAWHERRRQRRALLGLGDDLLKDIGVSRADAWREGTKPFWRD